MSRNTFILIAVLTAGAGLSAIAQESSAPASLTMNWNTFSRIGEKNIFNPLRRSGLSEAPPTPIYITPVIRSFTYRGTMDDRAIFTGDGVPSDSYFKAGDTINGFKVVQITVNYVKLAQPDGTSLALEADDSVRRANGGPWAKSDEPLPPPPPAATTSDTASDTSAVASAPGVAAAPANESEVLKRLREKREQEK